MTIRERIKRELRGGCVMTATQLAHVLGETPANVSSVCKQMRDRGDLHHWALGPRGGWAYEWARP